MTLQEFITIGGFILACGTALSLIIYNILKSKFITPEQCEKTQGAFRIQCKETQGACRMQTCQKIEGVKTQVAGIASEFKESRENSELKRDAARKEYSEKIEKIYRLIQETEEHRANQLEKMHVFMGEVRADLKTLKEKVS